MQGRRNALLTFKHFPSNPANLEFGKQCFTENFFRPALLGHEGVEAQQYRVQRPDATQRALVECLGVTPPRQNSCRCAKKTQRSTAASCCTSDEGRPLGIADQAEIPNYPELRP